MRGIRQHDTRDCGAACLATLLKFYGSVVPMIRIREHMRIDKNGASMYALCRSAEHFGFNAEGYEGTLNEIREEVTAGTIKLPLIAHVIVDDTLLHYVIIEKINDNTVIVFDPAKGKSKYKVCEFENLFTGFFISIKPNENFKKEKKSVGPYKKFMVIVTKQKKLFISAIILSLILAAFSIFASFSYQTIIDKYILENEEALNIKNTPILTDVYLYIEKLCNSLTQLFIAILTIYILQNVISGLRGIIITKIYKNSSNMLITNYCKKLINLPMPFFHNRETGEILSRYNDIEELQSIISGVGLSAIMDIVMAIAGGIVLFAINGKLFSIVIAMVVVYSLIVLCYKRPIRTISRDIMESDSRLMSRMKESVDGIESIKASCAENYIYKGLQKRVIEYVDNIKKGSLLSVSQSVAMGLSQSLGNLAILYFGCKFVVTGSISLGTFISFETLIYFFISPIQNLLSMQLALQQAIVAADRLNDIMESNSDDEILSTNAEEPFKNIVKTRIRINKLKFAYGYREDVLKNITFDISSGEKVALIGKSGCGKTTLLHLIGRLEDGYGGTIYINESSIQNIDKHIYRESVIYIPQESAIFADSIKNNILLGYEAEELKLNEIIEGCKLNEIIEEQIRGIDTIIEESGKNLSGGQKQRIAIARALVRNPEVLLLDESTSHLDEKTEKDIFEFIYQHYPHMICVFSTHRESLISQCDKTIHIIKGNIEENGTTY